MKDIGSHKILVIEPNDDLRTDICDKIQSMGYEPEEAKSYSTALSALEQQPPIPLALIISCYRLPPGPNGDVILLKAREVYPDAPRLLVAEVTDLHSIVGAINSAGINSCLSVPFQDEDLKAHIEDGIEQFIAIKKRKRLINTTERQNKQMFLAANTLKKKQEAHLSQIKEKEKTIRMLKARAETKEGGDITENVPISLKELLISMRTMISQEGLVSDFLNLKNLLKNFLENSAAEKKIKLNAVNYSDILNRSAMVGNSSEGIWEILSPFYSHVKENVAPKKETPGQKIVRKEAIDDYIEMILSENKTKAYIRIKTLDREILTIENIKQFLYKNDILVGLKADHIVASWLKNTKEGDAPFAIAEAKDPELSKNAELFYHFQTDFPQTGKINLDGSIDFKDRGEVPFVEKNNLLAEKMFPKFGSDGMDVFGDVISVDEPEDLCFNSGPGTFLSEDETKIFAAVEGQPYLDALGTVSILSEMRIKGDVDFKTGNIQFDGNIIVEGSIKQGFSVKGVSLTVNQIEGADAIILSGDLNVSNGIIDAHNIVVMGNIQTKYINNSTIDSFGDLTVQKEIIGSKIRLSGACIIDKGTILTSEINAKRGISAGNIGTDVSKPSKLTVGVDEYLNSLVAEIDSKLKKNQKLMEHMKMEIEELEKEAQDLHGIITGYAHVQDSCERELRGIDDKLANLQASGNMVAYQKVKQSIEEMNEKAALAEDAINKGFERQDKIDVEITKLTGSMKSMEDANQALVYEKKSLKEFHCKEAPISEVKVSKKLMARTQIIASNCSTVIKESLAKCKIIEVQNKGNAMGGLYSYEMKIVPL